jgi:hypothetical protein
VAGVGNCTPEQSGREARAAGWVVRAQCKRASEKDNAGIDVADAAEVRIETNLIP